MTTHLNNSRRPLLMRHVRFVVAGLVVGATAAFATPAIGFGSRQALPAKMVSDSRERVAAAMTHDGKAIGLWLAATAGGGQCLLLHVDGSAPGAPLGNAGRICSKSPAPPQAVPIMAIVTWMRGADDRFEVILTGRAAPSSGITRIALLGSGDPSTLSMGRGYFVGALGTTGESGVLPDAGTSFEVVGFGPRGDVRVDLEELLATAQPKS